MITHPETDDGLRRVTLTLDAVDVDLLDRMGHLFGTNRSSQVREVLRRMRPGLREAVEAFEAANTSRERFLEIAEQVGGQEMSTFVPELDRLHKAFLGAVARIEGAMTADSADDGSGL